jgi:hypothetical protein
MVFGHDTRSIEKVILISFHPYKERPKWSPNRIRLGLLVLLVLVQTFQIGFCFIVSLATATSM